jgi:hypothetical protein
MLGLLRMLDVGVIRDAEDSEVAEDVTIRLLGLQRLLRMRRLLILLRLLRILSLLKMLSTLRLLSVEVAEREKRDKKRKDD